MKRYLIILALAMVVAGVSFTLTRGLAPAGDEDQKTWLQREFKLDATQAAAVEKMQAAYQPVCAEHCRLIVEARDRLAASPADSAVQQEVTRLEQKCHDATLQHLREVAAQMSPYLLLGVLQAAIVIGLAHVLLQVPLLGDFKALMLAALLLAAAHLVLGFALSGLAANQMQAIQGAVFSRRRGMRATAGRHGRAYQRAALYPAHRSPPSWPRRIVLRCSFPIRAGASTRRWAIAPKAGRNGPACPRARPHLAVISARSSPLRITSRFSLLIR